MTAARMYEKIGKILDENTPKAFYNDESGTYFTMDGFVAYHIPDMQILSANNKFPNSNKFLFDLFEQAENKKLAELIVTGTHPAKNRKICKLSVNDDLYAFVQASFIRDFPKNTVYYVSGYNKPVLAGIWDFDRLYPFAIIMPYRLEPEQFQPDYKEELIAEILTNNPYETEKHLKSLSVNVLETQLHNYRKYNADWKITSSF